MLGRTLIRQAKFVHRPIKSRFHKAPSDNLFVRGEGAKPISGHVDMFTWWSQQGMSNINAAMAFAVLGSFLVVAVTGSEP